VDLVSFVVGLVVGQKVQNSMHLRTDERLKKQNDVEKQKQMAPILFPELLQLYIQ
jgi:capsular polysaccharide biosynthesis protein